LFFVADGTGGHAFAETYEQHQKNVARLRSIESDQKDQVPIGDQLTAPAPQPSPAGSAAPVAPPARAGAPKPHATTPH
jgi:UPF0755 protein